MGEKQVKNLISLVPENCMQAACVHHVLTCHAPEFKCIPWADAVFWPAQDLRSVEEKHADLMLDEAQKAAMSAPWWGQVSQLDKEKAAMCAAAVRALVAAKAHEVWKRRRRDGGRQGQVGRELGRGE
eukprot:1692448-Pleurochrysis_carterae.AAC.1